MIDFEQSNRDGKLGGEPVKFGSVDLAQDNHAAGDRMTGLPTAPTTLNNHVWYLIFQNLDAHADFYNLCLVSKTFYSLAFAYLYHTINLGPRKLTHAEKFQARFSVFENFVKKGEDQDDKKRSKRMQSRDAQWDESRTLIRRLAQTPSEIQAQAVRDVEILDSPGDEKNAAQELNQDGALATLVAALPNLQNFRLHSSSSNFEDLILSLNTHANHPQLHLLGESGSKPVTGPYPCVSTIQARVNPYHDTRDEPNQRIPHLQQLFFACPNLKSFSLSTFGNYGGCCIRIPHHALATSFVCTGEEIFPPLEFLSFDRRMSLEEWPHWRDRFDWSNLRSLSLGRQLDTGLLERLQECPIALRALKVETWAGESNRSNGRFRDACPQLEDFLLTFDTLERLTIRGVSVANIALTKHSGLKQLCLHAIELPRDGARRPMLCVADLNELDTNCPNLETLEIDIDRDGGWPKDILQALAAKFIKLRHLTLHCEVGIDWDNSSWARGSRHERTALFPRLDENFTKEFAREFFTLRSSSKLEILTFKTGENLRRFPQWPPAYQSIERDFSETIHIRAPSGPEGELVVTIEKKDHWF